MAIQTETVHSSFPASFLSWRSVFAGLLISFLTMLGLIGLGMAVGGIGLEDGAQLKNAGIFTGVWSLVAVLLSIFAGSYFASRTAVFSSAKVGAAHGLLIATLFVSMMIWQAVMTVGMLGSAAGSMVSGAAQMAGQGVRQAAQSPVVQNAVEDAIGDLNLRADPQVVAVGVMNRLMAGNTEAAKTYLARQANVSPDEVDARIATLQAQMQQGLTQAREVAAGALQATGWSLFLTVVLSVIAALAGGILGARLNLRAPMATEDLRSTRFRPATV